MPFNFHPQSPRSSHGPEGARNPIRAIRGRLRQAELMGCGDAMLIAVEDLCVLSEQSEHGWLDHIRANRKSSFQTKTRRYQLIAEQTDTTLLLFKRMIHDLTVAGQADRALAQQRKQALWCGMPSWTLP